MTELPRCWNCPFAEEAYKRKPAEEYEAAKDFVFCELCKSYMYRHDYCTQHPSIVREVERLKNANQK